MIYRVKFKINYTEIFFDFKNSEDALKIMEQASQCVNNSLSEDKLKITMMIVTKENPASGN